ncbi:ABC transporter permease [Microbacterium sp. SLBN-146]|uniref:ABC transporter permease n=1 Tax=Microbacterium sp. SLBN-146 TaxID=2768457 RepID=UPI001151D1D7|nr:ABC transporter permease [Microbacterium sp. SLBN-146]TQJ32006.1 ABC-2 type transport system permease protein [Microbacterium sp. SLBN-146]
MTSLTAPETDVSAPASRYADGHRVSFLRLLRSEWIKLTTLRSPWWSIAIVAVMTVGFALLAAWSLQSIPDDIGGPAGVGAGTAVNMVLLPTSFTVLLAAILGSIQITGEYSTGMIRSTLTAAPGRIGSLLAKCVVVGGFVFVASVVIFTATAFAIAPVLAVSDIRFDLSDAGSTILPILAGSFMMAVIALIGLSAGYLLRNGPGAIALGVGVVFVLPLVPAFFPQTDEWQWIHDIADCLPTNAGQALMIADNAGALEPTVAFVTLVLWGAVGIAASAVGLKARDA